MILSTTEMIPGREYDVIGLVAGSTVQTTHLGRDIMSGLKTIVGGEAKAYTEMMHEARALSTKRMSEQARSMGADAVVSIRYASSAIMSSAAEVMAYGTAVKFR